MMTWEAGHWAWNGTTWDWTEGHYVQRPAPTAVWEPGHWAQETSGGYAARARRPPWRIAVGEAKMKLSHRAWLILPGLVTLAACGAPPPPPQTTQVIVQPPPQVQVVPAVAPMPPPAPHAELVPPPPAGGPEVWQPGHWNYTGMVGNPWVWVGGQYVPAPAGSTTWVPGRWAQQPTGGWVWLEGHWA